MHAARSRRGLRPRLGDLQAAGGGDEEAIARGVYNTYLTSNLRYSQMAPLNMYDEVNTGNNLPAEIKISAVDGDAYKFLFMAKGGGSANKSYLFQETKALLNEKALLPWLFDKMKTLGTAAKRRDRRLPARRRRSAAVPVSRLQGDAPAGA